MKKIISGILSGVLGVSLLLPLAACKDKKVTHNVGTWEIVTPATCMRDGERKGICGDCLKEVTEKIPSDPDAHVYGDWEVTAPTEAEAGSAKRVCSEEASHVENVSLPVLDEREYTYEITARPSVLGVGERTYTYKENPDIQFVETIPNTGIQTVRDAVDLGVDEGARVQIRRAEGQMGFQFFNPTPGSNNMHPHSYEYGDDYTHITDGAQDCERWYYKDKEGTLYGLTNFGGKGIVDDLGVASGDPGYINGTRFYLQYANDLGYYYGTESLLQGMYQSARWSDNGDFKEWTEKDGEKDVYAFSFGYAMNSGDDSGHFAIVTTKFILSDVYTIEWLNVEAVIYVNNFAQADGSIIKTWAFNDEGHAYVLNGQLQGVRYVSRIEMSQTRKTALDVVPTNPHTADKMYITSFDLKWADNDVISGYVDGQPIVFASGAPTNDVFQVCNIQPQSAMANYGFDTFSVYLRTADGDILLDHFDTNDANIRMAWEEKNSWEGRKFSLTPNLSGMQTIVVKTARLEKLLYCNISTEKPTALYPVAYEYEAGDYKRINPKSNDDPLRQTIYVNQPFYFTADVPDDQKYSSASTHTVTIKKINGVQEENIPNGNSLLSNDVKKKEAVTVFTPTEVGEYMLTLTSTLASARYCKIRVTVVAAPTFTALTAAENSYAGVVTIYPNQTTATVTFTDVQEITEPVLDANDELVTQGFTVTATVTTTQGSVETLSCVYNSASRVLTSRHSGGVEYGFILALNEGYDFVLTRYLENFSAYETVTLAKVIPA